MCKISNPRKKSSFICLKCEHKNDLMDGIQRHRQREKYHIKDCYCTICLEETKNIEVRYCDYYQDIESHVPLLHIKYYNKNTQ